MYYTPTANTNKTVYIRKPLGDIFKFFEVMDSPITLTTIQLRLTRASNTDNRAVFGSAGTVDISTEANGTGINSITLDIVTGKLSSIAKDEYWSRVRSDIIGNFTPRTLTTYSSESAIELQKTITLKNRPVFLCVIPKITATGATFNSQVIAHCDMQTIQVLYGGVSYPTLSQEANYGNDDYHRFYKGFVNFCNAMKYPCKIGYNEYKNLYNIFAIDLRSQVKNTLPTWTLSLEIKRRAAGAGDAIANINNPATVTYYVVIYVEKTLKINMETNSLVEYIQ